MDPQLKQIFDELNTVMSSVEDPNNSLAQHIDGVEKSLGDRFLSLERAAQTVDEWKPRVDSSVEDLRVEIGALRKTVNGVILDMPSPSNSSILPMPVSAAASPSAGAPVDGLDGHRQEPNHREPVFGSVFTHTHLPVTGMNASTEPKIPSSSFHPQSHDIVPSTMIIVGENLLGGIVEFLRFCSLFLMGRTQSCG